MDRGAWQVTVHGVAKSRTWLSDFHFEQVYSLVKGHPEVLKKHPPGASDQCLLCEASHPCPRFPVSSRGPSGILWTNWGPWCRSVRKLGHDGDNSKGCYKHLLPPFIFFFPPPWVIWCFHYTYEEHWASLVGQMVKDLPAMWETRVQSLGWDWGSPGAGNGYPL